MDGVRCLTLATPIEDDFPTIALSHRRKTLLEFGEGKAMGDHGGNIQATLDHHGHFIPGLIHLTTVDAMDGEHVEDDLVPVDGDGLAGDAEHGDFAAVAHVVDHIAKGGGIAAHLQTHVEALLHAEFALHVS